MAEGEWSLNIRDLARRYEMKVNDVQKQLVFNIYSEVCRRTPVDSGRARGNWNISINELDDSVDENATSQKFTSIQQIPEPKRGDTIYIYNNLPYITKLEYGGYSEKPETEKTVKGFSKQAPHGMVGVTLANISRHFEEALRSGR